MTTSIKGETTPEIKNATGLNDGNFNHWVKTRLKIFPIGTFPINRNVVDVYPEGTIEKVKEILNK